jgi:Cdc6-like AAA superfamily ATPase
MIPHSSTEDAVPQQPENAETIDRKIIKNGNIEFETADVNKTKSLVEQTVRELSGYISKENVVEYSDRLEHKLIIRVPADNFDLLLKNISESVDKLDRKNIDVLDVTEEYIDVQSRIKTKKELQARYTELLEKAAGVVEMLAIESEIGKLQTEIESAEGRLRFLHDRIAFSTLEMTYYQKIASTSPFSFFPKLRDGIKSGWEFFLWFIIGLSYLWVFIVLFIIIAAVAHVLVRRRKKK